MLDRHQAERLFLENLGWIERVLATLAHRLELSPDDAEDFASWAKLRLIEDDYSALRRFRGESTPTTYLAVVLSRLARDYPVRERGQRQPSKAVRQLGPTAVHLGALVHRLWRVFPWDPAARAGAPFSVQSFAPKHAQGGGRFDLRDLTSVLYLATSAAHAYAEVLRGFPNTRLSDDHLVHASGHRLASVTVDIPLPLYESLPDLAVGEVLDRYGIRADTLALPPTRRAQTQAVARTVWDDGQAGFRWWSAFHGEWHSTVLFVERVKLDAMVFGAPRPASLSDFDVLTGAREARMIV